MHVYIHKKKFQTDKFKLPQYISIFKLEVLNVIRFVYDNSEHKQNVNFVKNYNCKTFQ